MASVDDEANYRDDDDSQEADNHEHDDFVCLLTGFQVSVVSLDLISELCKLAGSHIFLHSGKHFNVCFC